MWRLEVAGQVGRSALIVARAWPVLVVLRLESVNNDTGSPTPRAAASAGKMTPISEISAIAARGGSVCIGMVQMGQAVSQPNIGS